VVLLRIGGAALLLAVPTVRALGGRWYLLRRGWLQIVAFGLAAVAVPQLGFFYAIQHLSVGVAMLLEYLGLVLVVGGFSVAQLPAADRIARLVAPALGVAGGAVGLGAFTSGAHLPVIGGCAAGALVALGGRMSRGPDRHVPRVWLAFTAGVGMLTLGSVLVGAPMTAVATLALGVSTLLARVVPDLVLHVEDDVLLDIDRLSVTSWSPRATRRRRGRGGRVDDDAVGSLVAAATVGQTATLVGLAVVIVSGWLDDAEAIVRDMENFAEKLDRQESSVNRTQDESASTFSRAATRLSTRA